ncbi:hypothetical protein J4458_00225 [Candidatus Woesearchaeota archaeon]|nr:hypothetical protein [Candidatus Woesearchaeota archaeon]
MQIGVITSKKDMAGMNIRDSLINLFDFEKNNEKFGNNPIFQLNNTNLKNKKNNKIIKLYTIETDTIHSENIDKKINADLFIFATRHSASSGLKTLSCHSIGNFGKAEFGGKEKTLCISPSNFLKNAIIELDKYGKDIGHEVTMEATHHGPFIEKPAMFIEIGSNEENWKNKEAANIIAKTIINILNNKNDYESVFVIGGSHYNHAANKTMLKTSYAAGHICAKYNLEKLDENLIKEAMEKTSPKAKFVLLDWKGLGKEKQRILDILEKNKIRYERSDRFFENTG